MTPERLAFLQSQFDNQAMFLTPQHLKENSSFEAPDKVRFERHRICKRDESPPAPVTAWVAEGHVIRAWKDDYKNAAEIIGQPLAALTDPERGAWS